MISMIDLFVLVDVYKHLLICITTYDSVRCAGMNIYVHTDGHNLMHAISLHYALTT